MSILWYYTITYTMITLTSVSKTYKQGKETIHVLKDVSLTIKDGEKVAVVGPSGSGKSTLLSLMTGLDVPDTGTVVIDGVNINTLSEKDLSLFRNRKIAVIFQSFELISFFTAYENAMLPLAIRNEVDIPMLDELFETLGINHRKNNLPSELSGGEQQRVAIARALASSSLHIFADEPTGNLDTNNGKKILSLFLDTIKQKEKTLVIITHDMNIARMMDSVYELKDGSVHKHTKD